MCFKKIGLLILFLVFIAGKVFAAAPEELMRVTDVYPFQMKIPANLPVQNGKVTCQTCHNPCFLNRTKEYLLREDPLFLCIAGMEAMNNT